MDRRRLAGAVVLAVAVLVLSIGAALSRPLVAGVASAPAINPQPQVGDCLYTGPQNWSSLRPTSDDGASWGLDFSVVLARCDRPWNAQIVDVLMGVGGSEITMVPGDRPSNGVDICAPGMALFLDRPDFSDPEQRWVPAGPSADPLPPDRRQFAVGQRWAACLLFPPKWDEFGEAVPVRSEGDRFQTDEELRDRWRDPSVRDRMGVCGNGDAVVFDPSTVYCGRAHDRELMAYTYWDVAPDPATLIDTCLHQSSRMTQRPDPTAGGVFRTEVVVQDRSVESASRTIDAASVLDESWWAECWLRPTDPGQQLTATVIGLGAGDLPLVDR